MLRQLRRGTLIPLAAVHVAVEVVLAAVAEAAVFRQLAPRPVFYEYGQNGNLSHIWFK